MSNRRPATRRRIDAFLARTDPLVVQAMRKVFCGHRGDPHLTPEEQGALDAYLAPRIAGIVEEFAARRREWAA